MDNKDKNSLNSDASIKNISDGIQRELLNEEQRILDEAANNYEKKQQNTEDYDEYTTNNTMTKNDSNNKKLSRKERKRLKREKKKITYVGRLIASKDKVPLPMVILGIPFAFFLDLVRIVKNTILGLIVILIILGIVGGLFAWNKIEPIYNEYNDFAEDKVANSTVATFKPEESTFIYDSNGDLLVKLKGDQDSAYLEYEDIPSSAIDAFIAVEDRTFWENPGIDIKGIIRVGLDAIRTKGAETHGASTITQQLARNIFLTHEVSLERKGKEMLIAMKLTKKYTKQEILEFYINNICYANAIYGLESAAKGYFNKSSSELSLSQICYLCAIPNSPEYYNPYKHPKRAVKRRNKILDDMYELGFITEKQLKKAKKEKIKIEKPTYEFNNYQSTFAIDCATKYIMKTDGFEFKYTFDNTDDYNAYKEKYSESFNDAKHKLVTGGYKIYTTLDSTVQENMQSILDNGLSFDTEVDEATGIFALQGAITVVDNENGKVIATVGGRSQEGNENVYSLNRAYQSYRQPGSSIKPLIVYNPALLSGYTPESRVMDIDVTKAKEKGVDAQTLTGTSMTLREALERSKNGVAWQVFDKITPAFGLKFITDMKYSSICPDDYFDSASLGGLTHGVTTVEMAGGYSTLANHGYYREATCISKILDSSGENIYEDEDEVQIYSEKSSDTMVDMMTGVLTKGTASKLQWYNSTETVAACKTGTTNNSKDGWLCGFTPYYTVTVWVGFDQPKTLNNLYGATYPGQIWKESMLKLIENKPEIKEFVKSESYYDEEFTPSDEIPQSAYELYLPGRDDSEVLSSGYTVADYRSDRVIGESVTDVISQMYNTNDKQRIQELYDYGCSIVDTIYSRKYTSEMQGKLDSAYRSCIGN